MYTFSYQPIEAYQHRLADVSIFSYVHTLLFVNFTSTYGDLVLNISTGFLLFFYRKKFEKAFNTFKQLLKAFRASRGFAAQGFTAEYPYVCLPIPIRFLTHTHTFSYH